MSTTMEPRELIDHAEAILKMVAQHYSGGLHPFRSGPISGPNETARYKYGRLLGLSLGDYAEELDAAAHGGGDLAADLDKKDADED